MINQIAASILCLTTILCVGGFVLENPTRRGQSFIIRGDGNAMLLSPTSLMGSSSSSVSTSNDAAADLQQTTIVGKPKITQITSAEEYMDFLLEDDRLCIVKFHAPWCKLCHQFGVQYKRVAKDHGDLIGINCVDTQDDANSNNNNNNGNPTNSVSAANIVGDGDDDEEEIIVRKGNIRLAEVEFTGTGTLMEELCNSLGVKKFPSVHFYSQGRKIEGCTFSGSMQTMNSCLDGKISEYLSMSLDDLAFEADMNQGLELGESVLETLCMVDERTRASSKEERLALC